MSLFRNYSTQIIPLSQLFAEEEGLIRNYLGKKFKRTIESQMDQNYIKWCKRKTEELKLQIIDAAEAGKRPPNLYGVQWLYKVRYGPSEYRFLWDEFDSWLAINGLNCGFAGYEEDLRLNIVVSASVSTSGFKEPDGKSLLNDIIKPKE